MTKSELRKARRAARAAGKQLTGELMIEVSQSGHLEMVRTRSESEERAHEEHMSRWARQTYYLSGPTGPDDY